MIRCQSVTRSLHVALLGALCVLTGAPPEPVRADDLPRPAGAVILTIDGEIKRTNAPGRAEFDRAMLEELELVSMSVETPWTEPDTVFEGVRTRELMELVGARGRWVRAGAANDYRVDIPMSDLTEHDTLLAMSRDGEPMRLRDRGPLWILYADDDRPRVPEGELLARMVWQLTELTVR